MTRPQRIILTLAVITLCAALVPLAVSAQSTCWTVRVVNGLTANVRSGAASTFPPIADSITYASGEFRSCERQDGWYKIATGGKTGWVSSTYNGGLKLINVAVDSGIVQTPTPTVTRTATRTDTPTATPTRVIITSTPGATVSPYIVYEYGDNGILESATLYCPSACQWRIVAETLP